MMTRPLISLSICLLLLASGPSWAADLPPANWSAHEAVRFALANNPDSAIGQQRLASARAAIDLERAAMAPQLTLGANYSQTNAPMYSFGNILNQGEFRNTIDFNHPGRTDTLTGGLQLGYRIYNGGRDQAGVEAVGAEAAAARLELATVNARLAFAVVRAFHGLTQAADIIQAEQAAVEAVTASLGVAKARHESGVLLLDAVLDLEVQLSRAKENLIQAQHALALARKVFLTLLGISEGQTDITPEKGPEQEVPDDTTPGARFELLSLDAMINAAQARVRQAQATAMPAVDGYAGYLVDHGTITGGSGASWQAGVKMQYSLYDGERARAEVARAQARLAELKAERRKIELNIGLEIEQARLALRETAERLLVTDKTVAQARESAAINRARFSEGVVLSSDLIAVENRLTEATIRRTMAQTARSIAIADLRRAMGLPQYADLAEGQPEK
jgi:outer membrane protein TolC